MMGATLLAVWLADSAIFGRGSQRAAAVGRPGAADQ
jgi:hypothetical protein